MKILFVDDDIKLCEILSLYFIKENYEMDIVHTSKNAIEKLRMNQYDLVILDIMLDEMNGYQILEQLRKGIYDHGDVQNAKTLVILLTALSENYHIIEGLQNGADDYITKPFDPAILLLKIQGLFRRTLKQNRRIELSNIRIDLDNYGVYVEDKKIPLKRKEYQLLLLLMKNPGITLTREQLINQIWGYDFLGYNRVVDVTITRLRTIMKQYHGHIQIHTIWGIGYQLEA